MDIRTYWQSVRQIEAALPPQEESFWLYPQDSDSKGTHEHSLDSKGDNSGPPQLVEVSRLEAAKRLVEKTHRIAKKEEIEAFLQRVEVRSQKNIAKESQRAMKNITLSPEQFVQALRGVMPTPEVDPKPPTKRSAA